MARKHGAFLLMAVLLSLPMPWAAAVHSEEESLGIAVLRNEPAELNSNDARSALEWHVGGLDIEGFGFADLRVRAVDVFDPTSRIIINDGESETIELPPQTRFMRGEILDIPGSIVALTITPDGAITGLMTDGATTWEIGRRSSASALETAEIAMDAQAEERPFACSNDRLMELPEEHRDAVSASVSTQAAPLAAGHIYLATVAIETDHEFFERFGNATAASNYIASLFNYISGIYEAETQTRLVLGDVFLWSTTNDPWVETGDTACRLYEFGRYWRSHRSGVTRTLAHFLSGESLGGGIGWMNVLCSAPRLYNQSTGCASVGNELVAGGFAVSANLSGTIETASGIAWDAVVVAHEIGHNFSSPHTHCYGGVGGVTSPVDACWNLESGSGCWSGTATLPGTDSLGGGTAGARQGTIMSYCHQRTGGISNIAATFGWGHPFGISADRVPELMFDRVAAVSASNPSCIPIVQQQPVALSVNLTGNGRVTSTPTGIDCGSICSSDFGAGETVTLTADPGAGYTLAAWGGVCSGNAETCVITLDSVRTATAEFVPLSSLFNISTRARVREGAGKLIGGFVVRGEDSRRILIKARGPSLRVAGVADAMNDPTLRLFSGTSEIGFNDNWQEGGLSGDIMETGRAPKVDEESALIATLAPGAYTIHVEDRNGESGVAIVEVVALDDSTTSRLFNLSTRARVETEGNVAIGGFVIEGEAAKRVLIRARGPSLAAANVEGPLSNPTLELFSGASSIAFNNDWKQGEQQSEIIATGRAPTDDRESALISKLAPGAYTAIMRGFNDEMGVGLIEVIAIDEE